MTDLMEGFKVLRCTFSEESTAQHQLFVKEHSVRNQTADKPAGKTLFVINVPPYATKKSLKRVFSVAGPVKYVNLYDDAKHTREESKTLGYKVAYIVYEKSSDLKKALKLDCVGPFSTSEHPIVLGLPKWIQEYNNSVVDRKKLSHYCTQIINKYDNDREKAEKNQSVTDDEGWTVVTNKGRHSGVARTETNKNKLSEKKMKGLKNFYTFQIRENKKNEIVALRKKYDEDKKRIETIKKARRFKPY
ncbi:Ribosomal RNA-processing protein 7 (RRP7) C-terminal domain [Popillia japonica]|uniref:Ribosomal RNA-processing protein 7 (RRP7) C-terminal domain n=1 Tax=Popillia japonica TaxID=7064 RepID=A0AAW1JUC2_POPJA